MSSDKIERAIREVASRATLDENKRHALRNIFRHFESLGLDLLILSSNMTSDKTKAQGPSTASPACDKGPKADTPTIASVKPAGDKKHSTATSAADSSGHVIVEDAAVSPTAGPSSHPEQKLDGTASAAKPNSSSPAPIVYLNRNSTSDEANSRVVVSSDYASGPTRDKGKGKAKAVQEPIGTRGDNFSPTRPPVWFTTDVGPGSEAPGGHYLKLFNLHKGQLSGTLKALYDNYNWGNKLRGVHCPTSEGTQSEIFLNFNDIADADRAIHEVEVVDPTLQIKYICQTEYAAIKRNSANGSGEATSFHDGQVLFFCEFTGPSSEFYVGDLEENVRAVATSYGTVVAFTEWEKDNGKHQFRVEYATISAAKDAITTMEARKVPLIMDRWTIESKELPDWSVTAMPQSNVHYLESSVYANGAVTPPQTLPNGTQIQYTSPTGRTAWTLDSNGNRVPVPAPKQLPKSHGASNAPGASTGMVRVQSEPFAYAAPPYFTGQDPRAASMWANPAFVAASPTGLFYHSGPKFTTDGPNKIYPQKIIEGTDVRTSIMLRNLPNEMTSQELKQLLDQVLYGKYDFLYLRIDFNNNKNVGYAFLNLVDPMDIVGFYEHQYNKPWVQAPAGSGRRRFRPRIADLAYGTIQGLDCLIEKMRNSSVMDENRDYRPKLLWTTASAPTPSMVGQEKDFPPVNNPSKKQRSRDNAGQIGLYASGSRGKRNGMANGAHQSQFDRGTTAQLQEEAYFNQMSPMQNGGAQQMSPMQSGVAHHMSAMHNGVAHHMTPMRNGIPPHMSPMHNGAGSHMSPVNFSHHGHMAAGGGMTPPSQFHVNQYGSPYGNGVPVMDPMSHGRLPMHSAVNNGNGFGHAGQGSAYHSMNGSQQVYVAPHRRFSTNQTQDPSMNGPQYAYYPGPGHYSVPRAISEEMQGSGNGANGYYDGSSGQQYPGVSH